MPEQMLENRAYRLLTKLPVFEGVFFLGKKISLLLKPMLKNLLVTAIAFLMFTFNRENLVRWGCQD